MREVPPPPSYPNQVVAWPRRRQLLRMSTSGGSVVVRPSLSASICRVRSATRASLPGHPPCANPEGGGWFTPQPDPPPKTASALQKGGRSGPAHTPLSTPHKAPWASSAVSAVSPVDDPTAGQSATEIGPRRYVDRNVSDPQAAQGIDRGHCRTPRISQEVSARHKVPTAQPSPPPGSGRLHPDPPAIGP